MPEQLTAFKIETRLEDNARKIPGKKKAVLADSPVQTYVFLRELS